MVKGGHWSEEQRKKMKLIAKTNPNLGMRGKHHSEEVKIKISEARKGKCCGKDNPAFGRHFTEEQRKKISEIQKARFKDKTNHPSFGKHLSEERKRKLIESRKGKPGYWKGKHHPEETKRKISKSRTGKYKGEKNNFWQGGISFQKYGIEFNNQLKNQVKLRDGFTCQLCKITNNDLFEVRLLDIHHIDYKKTNNNPKNLITLCHNCHGKTHHNRKYWTKYFIRIQRSTN